MATRSEMIKEIRERIKKKDYPKTVSQAIRAEAHDDLIGAGLYWGLISAPRRQAYYLAMNDCIESAKLLKLEKEIPRKFNKLCGHEFAKAWGEYLKHL
jgi:hypothetical protein